MKKKIVVLLLALMILPLMGLAAQDASSFTILSFDIGYAPGYDLDADETLTDSYFALNVRVADPLSVGFAIIGTTPTTLLKVKYDILPKARAVVSFGNGIVGLGFEAVPFIRKTSGLSTEFKLVLDYLWEPKSGLDAGKLYLGLDVGIGI
jgi:hypothetical protein